MCSLVDGMKGKKKVRPLPLCVWDTEENNDVSRQMFVDALEAFSWSRPGQNDLDGEWFRSAGDMEVEEKPRSHFWLKRSIVL